MLDINDLLPMLNRICEQVHQDWKMANKKEGEESDEFKIDWDCRVETILFYSMRGYKPVGVNRHFMMICIHKRFINILHRQITSKRIWDHLDSLYDMAALHESEILPFPNEEVDYELPQDYYDLASDLLGVSLPDLDDESEDSKSDSNSKSVKKNIKSKQNGTPVSNPKNIFLTPTLGKSVKQSTVKNEVKPSNTPDNNVKIKQESQLSAKLNKVRRSSSPFTAKNSKTEQPSATKDESPDSPAVKKIKTESSTPASSKKTSRTESNSSSKKSAKQDQNPGSKQSRAGTPDTTVKKVKSEKDQSNKKGKVATPAEGSLNKKSSKIESKKSDQESSKKVDVSSSKLKSDRSSSTSSKGTRHEDSDSSLPSGSRKSLPAGKLDFNDKKKKKSSPVKRRRT